MRYLSLFSGIEAASVAKAHDLAGQRIGKLVVQRVDGRTKDKHVAWLCQCDCGQTKRVASNSLRRRNPVQSCGCMNRDTAQRKRRQGGPWNEGKSYVIDGGGHCYRTRHGWARAAIKHYGNRCERCGWDSARCDVHHREPKAGGGAHTLANAIVLCPNCHRIEHEKGRLT
jgi:5-methylcytosine-specific restriction endonuclease McrA